MSIQHSADVVFAKFKQRLLLNTCLTTTVLALFLAVVFCIGIYIITIYIPHTRVKSEWLEYKQLWASNAPSNYTIIIARGGGMCGEMENTFYVRGNTVISQSAHTKQSLCTLHGLMEQTPIEYLFLTTSECMASLLRCSVTYNEKYGYPESIDQVCIECSWAWTKVIKLQFNPQTEWI
jgi:hypothetical protein